MRTVAIACPSCAGKGTQSDYVAPFGDIPCGGCHGKGTVQAEPLPADSLEQFVRDEITMWRSVRGQPGSTATGIAQDHLERLEATMVARDWRS